MMSKVGWARRVREDILRMHGNDEEGREGGAYQNNGDDDSSAFQEGEFEEAPREALPAPSSYGLMRPPPSKEFIDTFVGTEPIDDETRRGRWLFRSSATRHNQLTNITGEDLPWLRRYVNDIQIVHHWDMPDYADDLQERMYIDILFRKSRSDLKDGMRERPMWISNILKQIFEQGAPKAPRDSTGYLNFLRGGRGERRY